MTLLPEYRLQLYTAATRRARRGPVSIARVWPVAVSTAVVVVVAVVVFAVGVLDQHRRPPSAAVLSGPAVPAGPLTDMLGVLRRPQTEADLQTWVPGAFATFASPGCRAANTPLQCTFRLDRPLVRQVVVPGFGYRVGLLPYTSAGKIAGLAVTLRGPGVDYLAAGPWSDITTIPPGLSALRTKGLLLPAYVSEGVNRGTIVVPDGVARVVLGPVRLTDRAITRGLGPAQGASAVVRDNVAVFQLNGLTVQKLQLRPGALREFFFEGSGGECRLTLAVYRLAAEAHMLWLAPDGRVINHTLIQLPVYVGVRHPAPGIVRVPPQCGSTG